MNLQKVKRKKEQDPNPYVSCTGTDPDPYQNVTDPQHFHFDTRYSLEIIIN